MLTKLDCQTSLILNFGGSAPRLFATPWVFCSDFDGPTAHLRSFEKKKKNLRSFDCATAVGDLLIRSKKLRLPFKRTHNFELFINRK